MQKEINILIQHIIGVQLTIELYLTVNMKFTRIAPNFNNRRQGHQKYFVNPAICLLKFSYERIQHQLR